MSSACLLHCHCAHAQVVPEATRAAVLAALVASGRPFEAVADLCEASARRDPLLARLAAKGPLTIAACYPRAVKWLFHAAGTTLPEGSVVLNMREAGAQAVVDGLLGGAPAGSDAAAPGAAGAVHGAEGAAS